MTTYEIFEKKIADLEAEKDKEIGRLQAELAKKDKGIERLSAMLGVPGYLKDGCLKVGEALIQKDEKIERLQAKLDEKEDDIKIYEKRERDIGGIVGSKGLNPNIVQDVKYLVEGLQAELAEFKEQYEIRVDMLKQRTLENERLREGVERIRDLDTECCQRCEGNGRLYADGKAHLINDNAATILCGNCGGSGRLLPEDAQQIAEQALKDKLIKEWQDKTNSELNINAAMHTEIATLKTALKDALAETQKIAEQYRQYTLTQSFR